MTTPTTTTHSSTEQQEQPVPPAQSDDPYAWMVSFGAAMVPFCAFLYGHQRGATVKVINAVVRSPLGAGGLLLLPFGTLAMEKCVYDTVQAAQGINPKARPANRGGFPSGGAEALPSFSLIPVQQRRQYQLPAAATATSAMPSSPPQVLQARTTKLE